MDFIYVLVNKLSQTICFDTQLCFGLICFDFKCLFKTYMYLSHTINVDLLVLICRPK